MNNLLLLSSLIFLLSGCNRSSINESSEGISTEQKVIVMTDEKQCKTAWGETLMSGESRKAYRQSETTSCRQTCEEISETITCKDGKLSNADAFIHPTCNRPKCDCKLDFLPNAPSLKHGDFVRLYTTQSIECKSCEQFEVQRQCVDGLLTGDANAKFQSCDSIACKDCPISTEFFVKHNESKLFFKTNRGLNCDAQKKCESAARSQTRTCSNGILSGDTAFNQLTCTNDFCSCTVQNSTYKHNENLNYYTRSESKCSDNFNCGDAGVKVSSKCVDGQIQGLSTGLTIFNSCAQEQCKCIFKDANNVETTLNDGQKIDVFSASTVACGVSCNTVKGQITCSRGKLSGNVNYVTTSCASNSCGCTHGQVRIDNGATKEVFTNASPICGIKCDSIKGFVSCTNGVLSGDTGKMATTCAEQTCDCSYQNTDAQMITITNATSAFVWEKKVATCGVTCNSMKGSVSCANTVLTGSTTFKANTCSEQKCECTTPWNTTVLAKDTYQLASKIPFYKMDKSKCGELKCAQTPNLIKYFACVKTGTTTVWMDDQQNIVTSFPEYKFNTCSNPSCYCTVQGKNINENAVMGFYKKDKVACGASCETADNYVSISCSSDLTYSVTPRDINLESFFRASPAPTTYCKPDDCPPGQVIGSPGGGGGNGDGQVGDGGGSGGGTGDGQGIGIGFGGRQSGGGGPGGPGTIRSTISTVTYQKMGTREACELPWGGKVSHGASVIAFKRQTAEAGKKCGFYRVNRICLEGQLTGDAQATYLKCEEP